MQMSLQSWLIIAWAFAAGALLPIQGPVNAELGGRLGHPLAAATLSFLAGTLALMAVTGLFARNNTDFSALPGLPPHLVLAGGLIGAIYVTTAIILTPRLGIAAVIALGIAGQVIMSLLLDHYGVLGLVERELSLGRVTGGIMVLVGALMVRFL